MFIIISAVDWGFVFVGLGKMSQILSLNEVNRMKGKQTAKSISSLPLVLLETSLSFGQFWVKMGVASILMSGETNFFHLSSDL
jgi:hypothetical protein